MTTFSSIRILAVSASLAMLAACGSGTDETADETAVAAGDAPPEIKQRHDNFEGLGDSFKVIRTQLEGGSPDMAAIEAAAADMNTRAQAISGLFPEGTSREAGFDTEALAAIWEDKPGFETAAQNLVDATAEMMTIAASGDAAAIGEQVKMVGGTCKACHDKFRLDDD